MRGQQAVPGDDRLLGDGRPAGHPELGRHHPLVHLCAGGEPRLLRVLRDDPAEGLDVLQRPTHQQRVGDAVAVVGEDPDAGRDDAIAPSSARRSPLRPTVTAPWGARRPGRPRYPAGTPAQRLRRRPRSGWRWASRRPPCSRRELLPLEPVSTVSASSRPGSRRWVCRSTSPGSRISPAPSDPVGVSGRGMVGRVVTDGRDHAPGQQHVLAATCSPYGAAPVISTDALMLLPFTPLVFTRWFSSPPSSR